MKKVAGRIRPRCISAILLVSYLVVGCYDSQPVVTNAEHSDFQNKSIIKKVLPPLQVIDDLKESLKSFRLSGDFQIELMAAEPLVQDPVAIDWGVDGRLWVVEMGDYPATSVNKTSSRIRFLEDTNDDGRYDRSVLFASGLSFANGIMAWRDGVLVSAAPNLIYFADTTGDGKADYREVLFSGFSTDSIQHSVHGFRWGLDNWVYVSNGEGGGDIKSVKTGKKLIMGGRDLRIDPDKGLMELQSGSSQHSRARDDWGNWFAGSASSFGWHYVLDDYYLSRSPFLNPPSPTHRLTEEGDLYPISKVVSHWQGFRPPVENRAYQVTSGCGMEIYRDLLLGRDYQGNIFLCDPALNLVHRRILKPEGFSFTSHRSPDNKKKEFLASTDLNFRPVMVRTGPDGALWIVDMRRAVIEHPDLISQQTKKKLSIREGDQQGRIYRIYPKLIDRSQLDFGGLKKIISIQFKEKRIAELVSALDSDNGWQRDMVHRLLLWRDDTAAVEFLKLLFRNTKRPQVRLHVISILSGLEQIDEEVLLKSLNDKHPEVRRHAVRLSEKRLSSSKTLTKAVLKLANDSNLQVQMQLAYSLGYLKSDAGARGLGKLLGRGANSIELAAAVISSLSSETIHLAVETAFENGYRWSSQSIDMLLSVAMSLSDEPIFSKRVSLLLMPAETEEEQIKQVLELAPLARSMVEHGWDINFLLGKEQVDSGSNLIQFASKIALDLNQIIEVRLAAIDILSAARLISPQENIDKLFQQVSELLVPQQSVLIQLRVMEMLAKSEHARVPDWLFRKWKNYSTILSDRAFDVLLTKNAWIDKLLDRIEKDISIRMLLGVRHRDLLERHANIRIRKRASKLLTKFTDKSREKVIEQYQKTLQIKGKAKLGQRVFIRNCAMCHAPDSEGNLIGPHLRIGKNYDAEKLLIDILDPNRSIDPKYMEYHLDLQDGRVISGLITQDTGTTLKMIDALRTPLVIKRKNIVAIQSAQQSIMPVGWEKQLTVKQLADLIAYLRSGLSVKIKDESQLNLLQSK